MRPASISNLHCIWPVNIWRLKARDNRFVTHSHFLHRHIIVNQNNALHSKCFHALCGSIVLSQCKQTCVLTITVVHWVRRSVFDYHISYCLCSRLPRVCTLYNRYFFHLIALQLTYLIVIVLKSL